MVGPKKGGGLELISGAIDDATPAPKVGRARTVAEQLEEPEFPLLDPGCPVTPLGKLGQVCHFLDEARQLISLDPQKVSKNHIRNLFGRKSHLCDEYWPRLDDKGNPKGHGQWHPEIAGDILMRACAFAGIFDPQGRVHGRGAHRGEGGELVLHCGDVIYITGPDGGYVQPGLIGRFVYPSGEALPRPDPLEADTSTAELLLNLFKQWEWQRPLIDPMLLLGWNAAALLGGYLDWRPHAWVTGSTSTGKSTLQTLMEYLHDGAALHTADATEASLRQLLRQQTLPVFFDEAESEEDNRKNKGVIKQARLASSGAQAFRGGQDHVGHEFIIRSCFLFSSILLPPMLTQDRNRLAILELNKLPIHAEEPVLDHAEISAWGRKLRRRLIDQIERFRPLYLAYAKALADVGHSGRGQKQFGTMLALADLLLYDVADPETMLEWAERLDAGTLAEKADDLPDEEEAVLRLASSFLPQRGGEEPAPVARMIRDALQPGADKARERIENFGLRIVEKTETGARDPQPGTLSTALYLAIANSNVALNKLFEPTRWGEGVWSQAFGRVEGAHKRVMVRFAGAKPVKATLIPLTAILELEAAKPDA